MPRKEYTKIVNNKQEGEELVPKIMIDYLENLSRQNSDWELAIQEVVKRRKKNG